MVILVLNFILSFYFVDKVIFILDADQIPVETMAVAVQNHENENVPSCSNRNFETASTSSLNMMQWLLDTSIFVPIKALTTHLVGPWVIKARVIAKSRIREFQKVSRS